MACSVRSRAWVVPVQIYRPFVQRERVGRVLTVHRQFGGAARKVMKMQHLDNRSPSTSAPSPRRKLHRTVPAVAALGVAAALVLAQQSGAAGATAASPLVGHLDSVSVATGEVVLHGWAANLKTPHVSAHIRYTIGAAASGRWLAHDPRPDVAVAFPALGGQHGFNVPVYVAPGSYLVCATINEPAAGPAKSLGCVRANVPADHAPNGHVDAVRSVGNSHIEVKGWTSDPDTPTTPTSIGIFVGGQPGHAFVSYPAVANKSRPDVAAAFPALGPLHGFDVTVAARPGTYPVCIVANNNYMYGAPRLLGCVTVKV